MYVSEKDMVGRLSSQGYRITQARRAIIRVLLDTSECLSPEQLLCLAREHCRRVSLVTTYRTLDLLSGLGFVRRVHSGQACNGFAKVARGHRHHLICTECGRVVDFAGCDISPLVTRVEQETGFIIDNHMLEFSGICSSCRAGDGRTPDAADAPTSRRRSGASKCEMGALQ